ncbi:MAG TPA: hypothetical protein VFK05_35795 [Polyangiaceae bacterium]|nr:hypothetical protein [Polyangiaceae bacterium]
MNSIDHRRISTKRAESQRIEAAHARLASACRLGAQGATGVLIGIFLSGPLAVGLVNVTHPQPPWHGARAFAAAYHPLQLLPYLGGIVLVSALLVLMASLREVAPEVHRARVGAALIFSSAFAALIFFNYVVQCTFLPELTRDYDPDDAALIAALSMSNPTSLAWGIEMWGWGLLGIATWLAAPAFRASGLERATARCFAANAPLSIAGALLTVVRPGWVMTLPGLVAFGAWNLLLTAMALLAWLSLRRREQRPHLHAVHFQPLAAAKAR